MTDGSLTPELALAYLRELSVDVRAAVVLDAAGKRLAGDASLVERACTALASDAPLAAGTRFVRSETETLAVARGATGTVIAVSVGPHAVIPLMLHDLEATVGELA